MCVYVYIKPLLLYFVLQTLVHHCEEACVEYSRVLFCVSGGRYIVEEYGLRILNITEGDNGRYTCRAEVAAAGRFDMRVIDVIVHSMYRFNMRVIDVIVHNMYTFAVSCRC